MKQYTLTPEAREGIEAFEPRDDHEATVRQTVLEAIATSKKVVFTYTDAKGSGSARVVEPLGIKTSKAGDLLLVANDLGRNAPRSFRVDRIRSLEGLL